MNIFFTRDFWVKDLRNIFAHMFMCQWVATIPYILSGLIWLAILFSFIFAVTVEVIQFIKRQRRDTANTVKDILVDILGMSLLFLLIRFM